MQIGINKKCFLITKQYIVMLVLNLVCFFTVISVVKIFCVVFLKQSKQNITKMVIHNKHDILLNFFDHLFLLFECVHEDVCMFFFVFRVKEKNKEIKRNKRKNEQNKKIIFAAATSVLDCNLVLWWSFSAVVNVV